MDKLLAMETFVRVVRAGSLSAAARHWGRSKARISQTLTALEAELQLTLLQRNTRSLRLTDAGRAYFERSVDLLEQLEAFETDLKSDKSGLEGTLRVTAPPSLVLQYLPLFTSSFHASHRGVTIDLDLAHRFLDLVEEGIDLAVRVMAPRDSALIARRLAPVSIVAVAAPSYLERHGRPRAPEELKRHRCLVDTNLRGQQRWSFLTPRGRQSVGVSGPFRVNAPEALRDLALAGHGVTLLPGFLAQEHLAHGRLVELFPGRVAVSWSVYAVYPRRAHLPERVKAYIAHLARGLREVRL